MQPHYYVGTNILLEKDGKILMSRRQNTGWADGQLIIPGGHVEPGEFPSHAAIREAKEELALELEPTDLVYLCTETKRSDDRLYISVMYRVKTDQKPTNAEPEKCKELVWIDPKNLPDDVAPSFKNVIEKAYLGKQTNVEFAA